MRYFIDFQNATIENPLSDGGNWVNGGTTGLDWSDVKVAAKANIGRNLAETTQSGAGSNFADAIAILSGVGSWGPNQSIQATVSSPSSTASSSTNEIELLLRFSISAHNAHGYECLWSWGGSVSIVRWNGNFSDFTTIASNATPSVLIGDGALLKATITGSTITMYTNGVQVLQVTDTTWSSGSPGIGLDWVGDNTSGTNNDFGYAQVWAVDSVFPVIANPTVVQTSSVSSGSSISQTGLSISPGDLIVVAAINANAGAPRNVNTVTDNGAAGGNTYTKVAGATNTTNANVKTEMWYTIATKSATSVTVDYGGLTSTFRMVAVWDSNAFTSPILDSNGVGQVSNQTCVGNNNTGTGQQALGPSLTISYDNCLMFAFCSPNDAIDATTGNPRKRNEFKCGNATSGSGPCASTAQPLISGVHQPMWTDNTSGDAFGASVITFAETQLGDDTISMSGRWNIRI